MSIFSKIFGDANARTVKQLESQVARINELEPQFESFSSEELKAKTAEFKKRLSDTDSFVNKVLSQPIIQLFGNIDDFRSSQ